MNTIVKLVLKNPNGTLYNVSRSQKDVVKITTKNVMNFNFTDKKDVLKISFLNKKNKIEYILLYNSLYGCYEDITKEDMNLF